MRAGGAWLLLVFVFTAGCACGRGAERPEHLAGEAPVDGDLSADIREAGDLGRDPSIDLVDGAPTDAALDLEVGLGGEPHFVIRGSANVPDGVLMSVVVHALDSGGMIDASRSGWIGIEVEGEGGFEAERLLLRRGVGSVTGRFTGPEIVIGVVGYEGAALHVAATSGSVVEVGGELRAGDIRWSGVVRFATDVRVPAGATLVIEAGTVVLGAARANLIVDGSLRVLGTEEAPVLFAPTEAEAPWGGVVIRATAEVAWAAFVGAGADDSRAFGHSDSQGVLFGEDATVTLADIVIQDGPGKAMAARRGVWRIERALVTRTDTGGEFENVELTLIDSHYYDFPEVDPAQRDDDNDAIYLLGDPALVDPPRSRLERVTFISGADDGIDHNGSHVEVVESWIEGFDNEGIAASSGGRVGVTDTVIADCGQGIEAGYGAPLVEVDHVVVRGCGVGLRFGDNYTREYTGELRVADSVIQANTERAVWNWVLTDESPRVGAVQISTSLLDVDEAEGGDGNVVGAVVWGDDLMLDPSSPGVGIASDGGDPGLITPRAGFVD